MTIQPVDYDSPTYRGREKSKRQRAALAIAEARRLTRELRKERALEAALDAEYGPRLDRKE